MNCDFCAFNGGCQLQDVAPDITGCTGHSKYKERPKRQESNRHTTQRQPDNPKLEDFKKGGTVIADGNQYNLRTFRLPGYLAGQQLKVIGITKEKVICDWDGGKPFHIPPELLRIRR